MVVGAMRRDRILDVDFEAFATLRWMQAAERDDW